MKETKTLDETKRKNKLFERKDKLRDEKIKEEYNKELKNLGKKARNETKILNEIGVEEKDDDFDEE